MRRNPAQHWSRRWKVSPDSDVLTPMGETLRVMWLRGDMIKDILVALGLTESQRAQVRNAAAKLFGPHPKSAWTEDKRAAFAQMWAGGASRRAIAKAFGITQRGVQGRRADYGLPARTRAEFTPIAPDPLRQKILAALQAAPRPLSAMELAAATRATKKIHTLLYYMRKEGHITCETSKPRGARMALKHYSITPAGSARLGPPRSTQSSTNGSQGGV